MAKDKHELLAPFAEDIRAACPVDQFDWTEACKGDYCGGHGLIEEGSSVDCQHCRDVALARSPKKPA
jgi:hypothetical protein